MPYRIGLISLGCSKNQVDAEIMLAALDKDGFEIVDYLDGADAVIINTCGFIDDAKRESIENILEVVQLKNEGTVGSIIVTGCLSQLVKDEIFKEIPEVDAVFGIGANADIAALVRSVVEGEKLSLFPSRKGLPLNGDRVLTTPEYWAYLRVADGCSNCCSYCTIPAIRGGFRSRELEDLLDEAKCLADKGVKELILIAQDTTSYGLDLYGRLALPELLEKLSAIPGIQWLRLMYCYPDKVTNELIETIANNPKVLHYIDLPIQHIDDSILNAMNRKTSEEEIKNLLHNIRTRIPDMVIRTTVITGFPGEGEDEFEHLAVFLKETAFDRLGCFAFSPQNGTPAFDMPGQVDEKTSQHRAELIMQDQYETMNAINEKQVGKTFKVLVEGYDNYTDSYYGRSYMDAPEIIDCSILFTSPESLDEGDFVEVEVFDVSDYDLLGKTVD
ncbi:MAG: 30S ribosomal protein S12 methylthiotransferase RimO [Clostridiales bacterium]|nr:30S ribosomal protein S12 methylthiotransferase RimO [Clostridiales bacterium]